MNYEAPDAMMVSTVIPCYNQAHFLSDAIESVLGQTHPHIEIIVVDDGSADNTSEVAARYPGVHCIRQENQGLSAARNVGLHHSTGRYVVFLDADDRLLPDALANGLECFRAHPECAFIFGNYRHISADGSANPTVERSYLMDDRYAAFLRGNYIGMHATVMYQRRVFDIVGGFDTSLSSCEDYDIYLRIVRQFPIELHSKVVAEYRQHSANMSRNFPLMLTSALKVLRSQWPYIQGNKYHQHMYMVGIKYWNCYYARQAMRAVYLHLKAGACKQALLTSLMPLKYALSTLLYD